MIFELNNGFRNKIIILFSKEYRCVPVICQLGQTGQYIVKYISILD